ncbi:Rha family transcriptional regulator [Metapseudomonas otitidis]|nr:Rha family transcriptional regulator [Pseudomonas otitidis]
MSSREIAELTGKQHFHVKRDIENMLSELGKDPSSFGCIYLDTRNRKQEEYHLPRREVEILLTGYSIPLRAKVIDRLHELEEQAKGAAFRVPQSLPEALRLAAELAEKNEQLALENQEMAPKAVVFDNCVALRQESLATFVRTLKGVNTMAIITDHRIQSTASKSIASTTGASTSGLKSFPYRLNVIPPLW